MTSTLVRLLRIGALAAAGALAASASAAAPRNILLIVSDDLTACLGCYGNPICRTPNLDRLAQQGVLFTRAYCQNPVCGPSRASLMSGLYPEQNGITGNSYVPGSYRVATPSLANHPSLGGLLRAHGFVSMRIAKIYHMGIPFSIESGEPAGDEPESWDRAFNTLAPESASRGDIKLLSPKSTDFGTGFNRIIVPDGEEGTQADMLSTAQAIAILQTRTLRRSEDKKRLLRPTEGLFLAVGFVRPHVPLVAPRRPCAMTCDMA
jgi:iduronate 2-sulfatase